MAKPRAGNTNSAASGNRGRNPRTSGAAAAATPNAHGSTQRRSMSTKAELEEAAHSLSIAHHGNVMASTAVSFMSIYAIFNAGAFTACLAAIAANPGSKWIETAATNIWWAAVFFGIGIIGSSMLMITVFDFSRRKYSAYRSMLRRDKDPTDPRSVKLDWAAAVLLVIILSCTSFGVFNVVSAIKIPLP